MISNHLSELLTADDYIDALFFRIKYLSTACASLTKFGVQPIADADWVYLYRALVELYDMSHEGEISKKFVDAIERMDFLIYVLEFSVESCLGDATPLSLH